MALPGTAWFEALKRAESGGRNVPQSINSTGSAFGPYQFTVGTWNDVIRRHPELQLTPEDRYDPVAQEKAVRAFTSDNDARLRQGLGRSPTTSELTAAHRFGAGGALQLASANPNTPLSAVLPAAAAANPSWANRSAGDLLGGRRTSQGPSNMDPSLSQQSLAAGQQLAFGNLNPDLRGMIGAMLLSPSMHNQGLQLATAVIAGGGKSPLDEFATRSQVGQQYGLLPGSEAHREYVLTGRLPQPKAPESPFAKIDPKDYTPESLKVFRRTGDPTDLIARETPGEAFVGQPVTDARGSLVIRNKAGPLFEYDPQGNPVPYGTAQQPLQAQLPEAQRKQQATLGNLESSLDAYEQAVKDQPQDTWGSMMNTLKKGTNAILSTALPIPGTSVTLDIPVISGLGNVPSVAKLGGAYTDVMMQLKNLYELGAITGPDMEILGNALANPVKGGAFMTQSAILEQIKALRAGLERRRDALGPAPSVGNTLRSIQQEPRQPQRGSVNLGGAFDRAW